jgi:hypothetical protein
MNRLFISSREAYIPESTVTSASFDVEGIDGDDIDNLGMIVKLYGDEKDMGFMKVSDEEEGVWLVQAVFITASVKENLIINSTEKTIKVVTEGKQDDPIPVLKPFRGTAIQSLTIKEEA